MSFIQYLKDTRAELRHVAWPTRLQTVLYTAFVIGLSLFFAAYLGFFDYVFTTGLSRGIQFLPERPAVSEQQISTTTSSTIEFGADPATPTE